MYILQILISRRYHILLKSKLLFRISLVYLAYNVYIYYSRQMQSFIHRYSVFGLIYRVSSSLCNCNQLFFVRIFCFSLLFKCKYFHINVNLFTEIKTFISEQRKLLKSQYHTYHC